MANRIEKTVNKINEKLQDIERYKKTIELFQKKQQTPEILADIEENDRLIRSAQKAIKKLEGEMGLPV